MKITMVNLDLPERKAYFLDIEQDGVRDCTGIQCIEEPIIFNFNNNSYIFIPKSKVVHKLSETFIDIKVTEYKEIEQEKTINYYEDGWVTIYYEKLFDENILDFIKKPYGWESICAIDHFYNELIKDKKKIKTYVPCIKCSASKSAITTNVQLKSHIIECPICKSITKDRYYDSVLKDFSKLEVDNEIVALYELVSFLYDKKYDKFIFKHQLDQCAKIFTENKRLINAYNGHYWVCDNCNGLHKAKWVYESNSYPNLEPCHFCGKLAMDNIWYSVDKECLKEFKDVKIPFNIDDNIKNLLFSLLNNMIHQGMLHCNSIMLLNKFPLRNNNNE